MTDRFQQTVNQLSLVMTISEDIVKACRKADMPPEMVEVLMRMHEQQREIEKAVNNLRTSMVEMAKVLDQSANLQVNTMAIIEALTKKSGFSPEELLAAQEISQNAD